MQGNFISYIFSCQAYAAMPIRSSINLTDKVLHVNHAEQVSINRWCILISQRAESATKCSKIRLTSPLSLVISQTSLSDKSCTRQVQGSQNCEQTNPYRRKIYRYQWQKDFCELFFMFLKDQTRPVILDKEGFSPLQTSEFPRQNISKAAVATFSVLGLW